MRVRLGFLLFLSCVLLLAGCKPKDEPDRMQALRDYYGGLRTCSATAKLSADFGDKVQEFTLKMTVEKDVEATVEILAPEEIAGITARIKNGDSQLVFDDVVLETGPLPGGGITPVDALPTMLNVWANGYLQESGEEKLDGKRVYHLVWRNMSGETEIMHHGWFDRESFRPIRAEVLSNGAQVLRCEFELFEAG